MEKYLALKSEKIVSALYLVTGIIKDDDSMKWKIREESMSFISTATLFNTTSPIDKDRALEAFAASSNILISFLNICSISGLISKMNSSIIIHELEILMDVLHKNIPSEVHSAGYILSDSFFATDTLPEISKGQESSSRTKERPKIKALIVKDKKNDRRESIISLLKKDSNLTIKDFTKVIKDCSEKTIQRELIVLVEKGVIKRVGERRWSTYSLM